MAVVRVNTTTANAMLAALLSAFDNGAGPATILIYTGTMPATPETAITTQTLLGTLTCSEPTGSVASKTLTFSAITQDSSADATGTATWARINDAAGTAVMDVDVSATGGGGFLQFNTTSIVSGGPILITSLTVGL